MDARHRLCEGYLYKKGIYNKAWKKRYFVMYSDDRTMRYFKDKLSSAKRQNAKGIIHLTQIVKVELMQCAEPDDNCSDIDPGTYSPTMRSRAHSMLCTSVKPFAPCTRSKSADDGTKSELQSDRKYSFALISSSRNGILCAETIKNLKQFLSKLVPLTQGDEMYKTESFTLYKHKLIKYENEYIDLTNIWFLRFIPNTNVIKIGVSAYKNIKLLGLDKESAINVLNMIKSLFADSFSLTHHSLIDKIHIVHRKESIQNQFVGIYIDYIVIFRDLDEKRFKLVKNSVFFDKNAFREYSGLRNYILIPFNANTKIRKASKKHGKHCFFVSNAVGNVCYYFSVRNEQILHEWMTHLTPKRMPTNYPTSCLLSPILDDAASEPKEGFPNIMQMKNEYALNSLCRFTA